MKITISGVDIETGTLKISPSFGLLAVSSGGIPIGIYADLEMAQAVCTAIHGAAAKNVAKLLELANLDFDLASIEAAAAKLRASSRRGGGVGDFGGRMKLSDLFRDIARMQKHLSPSGRRAAEILSIEIMEFLWMRRESIGAPTKREASLVQEAALATCLQTLHSVLEGEIEIDL